MIRFASLGSGSRGNALLVQAGRTRLLIDCGFGPRVLAQRLARLGVVPEQIDAVLLTHEHSDHVAGVGALAKRFCCPVYLSPGTRRALERRQHAVPHLREFEVSAAFPIQDFQVRPYAVPHDAAEPTQFVLDAEGLSLGILTDAGRVTDAMRKALAGCAGLMLEFNHDATMLANGPYPARLKNRIAGGQGHLDNDTASDLLRQLHRGSLQAVLAAHLSETNNHPAQVAKQLGEVLGDNPVAWQIASQAAGSDWMTLQG
ncbi:MBL fold metallo-hydrolase [Denitromonas iodatirespirans]|uniref:MBL fold metallo-hydrolase n=1 Tax=Denitromonas iodatirespirans TaxID=2795389 RepID=A0A944DAG9_DENI1|nr:MBL fold metallo-hydrolase [Denitromonas iodatirespirans]MBT0961501.1 MBL fold metallo-hydrolase [Denitromonas iodatirespirans]